MIIENKNSPTIIQPTGAKSESQTASRDRAIAMIEQRQVAASLAPAQDLPVRNATSVQPEEYGVVNPPSSYKNEQLEQPSAEQPLEVQPKEAPKAPSEEPLSKHYANLARKERALRMQAQQLKAEREAFVASQAASKPAEVDHSKFVSRDKLLQDPFSVLNELGLTYDQLTNSALNQPKPEELRIQKLENDMKSELQKLRDMQEKAVKDAEQQQSQSYQQALNQIKMDTRQLVNSDPDSYEAIRSTRSINDVVELIETTFKEDGILMSVEDAAKQVEDYLSEEAFKLSQLKKIQNRLKANQARPSAPSSEQQAPKQQQTMKTLTNSVGSSRPLSARERAIAAMEGRLKR